MITREQIISEPIYWVEELNGKIYNAIVDYMDQHNFKQKDMANHLGISTGRMSQILNSGDINFSYGKIVSILLKLDLIPHFDLESKAEYIKKELNEYAYHTGTIKNKPFEKPKVAMKVIAHNSFHAQTTKPRLAVPHSIIHEAKVSYDSKNNKQRKIA